MKPLTELALLNAYLLAIERLMIEYKDRPERLKVEIERLRNGKG